jgi:HEAT repeat protein
MLMAKARALEQTLAELSKLRQEPTSAASIATLRIVLQGKSSHAAAKAAEIAAELEISDLKDDLVAAFERFLVDPVKTDPTCAAKAAIADALYRIGAAEHRVFLRGIRHVQMEPVWGGKADTATTLRGVCALGLVRANYRDALAELADLLADPEARARADAARAIAYSEDEHGVPLLRLKALVGDTDPTVITECLTALLQLAPQPSLAFVARFLDRDDSSMQEAAALALGTSRVAEAFPILRDWWERTREPGVRRTALLALAMLKRDAAIDFLLSLIATAEGPTARAAMTALGLYRHDTALVERVRSAAQRSDVDLRGLFQDAFG